MNAGNTEVYMRVIWAAAITFLLIGTAACAQMNTLPGVDGMTATPIAATPTISDAPLNAVTPASNLVLYRDAGLGFTFQYPANWKIEASTASPAQAAAHGTSVRIRNYNDVVRKGGFTPDQLGIDIVVFPELAQYGTLDNWVAKRPLYQDASYGPQKEIKVGGIRALSWTVTGPTAPDGVALIALAQGQWIYLLSAYPATSKHLGTFNQIVSSLHIP